MAVLSPDHKYFNATEPFQSHIHGTDRSFSSTYFLFFIATDKFAPHCSCAAFTGRVRSKWTSVPQLEQQYRRWTTNVSLL
ncbi:unnamed protein product, partial [Nesidiocoris tenuis]